MKLSYSSYKQTIESQIAIDEFKRETIEIYEAHLKIKCNLEKFIELGFEKKLTGNIVSQIEKDYKVNWELSFEYNLLDDYIVCGDYIEVVVPFICNIT